MKLTNNHVVCYFALGTAPVTQQIAGAGLAVYGVIGAVESLTKVIFHKMQNSAEMRRDKKERDYSKLYELKDKISTDISELKTSFSLLGWGFLTMIPIAGSVANGKMLHRAKTV